MITFGNTKTAKYTLYMQHPETKTPNWINSFSAAIGDTPLIRLDTLSRETGCNILGKAEFLNPGGSVKDRAALGLINAAEQDGSLSKNGIVVEGTAGNTGIGLVHICNERSYPCVIYMPDNQSPEKARLLQTLGADVRQVPAVPYKDPANFQKQAGAYAAKTHGAFWTNQFDNTANRDIHYHTTGPEIWLQTKASIDAFVTACGTGGTIAGVSRYLKEQNKNVRIVLADPMGSALYSYVKTGETTMSKGPSITEGIGNSRVTGNLADTEIDDAVQVSDKAMVDVLYKLLREEGWYLGSSSGINLSAAVLTALKLGPGHTIVTMLCDGGDKYQSRLYNQNFLKEKGLA